MGLLSQALKNFFPVNNGDANFASNCTIPYFNSSGNPTGCVSPSKLASVLGVTGKSNQLLASNLTNSGSVGFLSESSDCIAGINNPIQLYSIMLVGSNVENYMLVAVCNRAKWQKHVTLIWNDKAINTSTLSIAPNDSTQYGYSVSYDITNGSACSLYAKLLSW